MKFSSGNDKDLSTRYEKQYIISSFCSFYLFLNKYLAYFFLSQDEDEPGNKCTGSGLMAHPVAEKLDSLMVVMLAYIRDVCLPKGEHESRSHSTQR